MIEKLIEKTEVVKTQVWEAFDGKIFNSQSECEKYENSAAAMLMAKLQEIVINDNPKSSMLDDGGEAEFLTIVPVTQEHLDTMMKPIEDHFAKIAKLAGMPSLDNVEPKGIDDIISHFFKEE